jgi:hypothetical protein
VAVTNTVKGMYEKEGGLVMGELGSKSEAQEIGGRVFLPFADNQWIGEPRDTVECGD